MKFVKWEKAKKDDIILEFKEILDPCWLLRRFGFKYTETTRRFIGSCTVWYEILEPHWERCDTYMEEYLLDFYTQLEYENDFKRGI